MAGTIPIQAPSITGFAAQFPQPGLVMNHSIVGRYVNREADLLTNQNIPVIGDQYHPNTRQTRFGAPMAYRVNISANAVLSPGTLLLPRTVVKRLELAEQDKT